MKQLFCLLFLLISVIARTQTTAQWVSSSATQQWTKETAPAFSTAKQKADAVIELQQTQQVIEGFGTCFNELGWTSLNLLSKKDRDQILRELFAPGVGANFTICRMPVGANDFSRNWYSYNETAGDFEMKHFSIANDLQTLIPFIKAAQQYNPKIKIWASPWSPPSWMKYNQHYAARSVLGNVNFKSEEYGMDLTGINNGLPADKEGREGENMFIQEDQYFKAYALYFARFVDAYKKQKINISMVMPQNEFNSAQVFPSCTWTAAGLSKFISYLGPQMQQRNVQVFFGTMERANAKLVDTILTDPQSAPYIKGVGFQWAGKGAIPTIHQQYPNLRLYQTEQECGNGKNDWKYCVYAWDLMKQYFNNGANAYLYWNTSLKQGGISTWGWKQNSLVSVDTTKHTYSYNYEYYLIKHFSHYIQPGAKKLNTSGAYTNLLAFLNPDKSIVVVAQNEAMEDKTITIQIGNKMISPVLKANSFNTFLIR